MIKLNKEYMKIEGEQTEIMAEYMSLTAYLTRKFGAELVLDLIEGTLEEIGEIKCQEKG